MRTPTAGWERNLCDLAGKDEFCEAETRIFDERVLGGERAGVRHGETLLLKLNYS